MGTSEGTYEVEDIIDERIGKDGRREFRVRWRTYTEEDDTWEPLENLDGFCTSMIEAMRLKKKHKLEEKNEQQAEVEEHSADEGKDSSESQITNKTPTQSNVGRRGRKKGGGPRLLKNFEKRPSTSRKTHWEHRTLEVLTPEAWNKYGDLEKREISNLYIPDRIPTETEKLLCEFHPEVGRVTRNQLKAMRATQIKVEPDDVKTTDHPKKTSVKKTKKVNNNNATAADEPSVFAQAVKEVKAEADATEPSSIIFETKLSESPTLAVKTEASDECVLSALEQAKEGVEDEGTGHEEVQKRSRGRPRGSKRQKQSGRRNTSKATTSESGVSSTQQTRGRGRVRSGGSSTHKKNIHCEDEETQPKKKKLENTPQVSRKRGRKKSATPRNTKRKAISEETEKTDDSSADEPSSSMIIEDKLCENEISDGAVSRSPLDSDQSSCSAVERDLSESNNSPVTSDKRGPGRQTSKSKSAKSTAQKSRVKRKDEQKPCRARKATKSKAKGANKAEHMNDKNAVMAPDSSSKGYSVVESVEKSGNNEGSKETKTLSDTVTSPSDELLDGAHSAEPVPSASGTDVDLSSERHSAHPLIAEFSDFPIPKAPSATTLDLLMIRFATLEPDDSFMPAQTISELRAAVLQGNISLAKGSLRHSMWRNSALHLDEKRFGKNLVMEVCEKSCDDSHIFDDMLRLLVYAGARLDTVDDARGRTPLHMAAAKELWCRIRVLLSLRSPVNIKDKEGKTPLQIVLSSRAPNFYVVRAIYLLLEYGADVNEIIERHQKNRFVSRLIDYREKLTKHFEEARQKVLIDMTVKRTITPVIVRGLWECYGKNRFIQYDFKHESSYLPNVRYMYIIVLALFDYRGPRLWKMRMWGDSPFCKVLLNRKPARSLQADENGFVYAAELQNGFNQLHLQIKEAATWKKLLVLTQVLLVQLHKPMVIIPPPALEVAPESGTDWRKD